MFVLNEYGTEPETVLESHGIRVLTMDSIAFASPALAGEVIVTGSHGGASAGQYARRAGVAAVVCNDAGVGKDDAGIAGLRAVGADGVAGIAVGHDSARIGDGMDAWLNGVVTFVNDPARAAGVRPGLPLRDQAGALIEHLAASPAKRRADTGEGGDELRRIVVVDRPRGGVVLLDSMSQAGEDDRGRVVVAASNGGKESGRIAVLVGCACAVFNDAGVGKDGAGIAGLALMDRAGLPGVAASHLSAAISDGPDLWHSGVISHVNEAARAAGFQAGARVADAVRRFVERREG
ncbi:hypothetical protein Acsp04_45570 [Actinomadura sp. NBRC 104425]|uniref:hypothetical protein n=1 Tax=Actinomadura sp. NBRC 104425 TaxID=3032204 RepID=UPI0024A5A948|nr:hypothetical protein [Actinomadura sp. NBRC 104425]GLZ14322.1 hypothetical protein Acsp04_45570 [Actinomadura sp. NBRC 104425]